MSVSNALPLRVVQSWVCLALLTVPLATPAQGPTPEPTQAPAATVARAPDPAGTPASEENAASGHDMALIPGGEFTMGIEGPGRASPAHRVRLYPFYIDRREVTNAQYLEFCEATGRRLPEFWGMEEFCSGPEFPDHPVVGVSWADARAYARWRGLRLPSEAEWERAGRGGLEGKTYSHGDELDPGLYAPTGYTGAARPSRVASFPPNGFGLHDMTGNVCEWVADAYDEDYYRECPLLDPRGPAASTFKVIRGGGWHTGPGCSPVHFRNVLPGNWVDMNVGFRCAKHVGESAALEVERVLMADGLAAGLARYDELRADFSGAFYFDEPEFNEMGYRLIGAGRLDDALAILRLNALAYPFSYNAHDSLGEGYKLKGDRSRAIECYRRALALYPECETSQQGLSELGVTE